MRFPRYRVFSRCLRREGHRLAGSGTASQQLEVRLRNLGKWIYRPLGKKKKFFHFFLPLAPLTSPLSVRFLEGYTHLNRQKIPPHAIGSPNFDAMVEVRVGLGGVTQPVLQVAGRQMRHNVIAEHHAEPMRQQRVNVLCQTRTTDARLSKGVEAGHARLQSSGKDEISENWGWDSHREP